MEQPKRKYTDDKIRPILTEARARFNADNLCLLFDALEERLAPEPVNSLRDLAVRVGMEHCEEYHSLEFSEDSVHAVSDAMYVVADYVLDAPLAELTLDEAEQLNKLVRESRRAANVDFGEEIINWHESIRPARLARAKR